MSASPLLSNLPFWECLPLGVAVLDMQLHALYWNTWLRDRMRDHVAPREVLDLMSWGDSDWREFLRQVPAMSARLEGDFWLRIGVACDPPGLQVNVSFHRLNAPMDDTIVVVVSDISAVRHAEERLRESLTHVTELSDTAITQAVALRRSNHELEARVRERTTALRLANMDALHMLAVACEAKDHDTGEHVLRVQRYTELLASELGFSAAQAHEFGYSSLLHDVGKVHIPDAILAKPGPLTDEERRIINEHPLAGERILGHNPFFSTARRIARSHHENWDGSGYPDGLCRYAICVEARIVHVADVFDALTSTRPYKAAWGQVEALRTIAGMSGTAFDPEVVAALIELAARKAIDSSTAAA